jgi:hypothetical protein
VLEDAPHASLLAPASFAVVLAPTQRLDSPRCLHLLLSRLCSQMLDPPHCLHLLLSRLCSQMLDPPHCLHLLLQRLCSQMLIRRLCSQMLDPPPCLHLLLSRLCSQMLDPLQCLHLLLRRLCSQILSETPHCLLFFMADAQSIACFPFSTASSLPLPSKPPCLCLASSFLIFSSFWSPAPPHSPRSPLKLPKVWTVY